MDLHAAIDVFGKGFSFSRSRTRPAEFLRIGPMGVMRDVNHQASDARNQELIFANEDVESAREIIRAYQPPRHKLCWIVGNDVEDADACAQVKALGYRLMGREGFFVYDLTDKDPPLQRPIDQEAGVRYVDGEEAHKILAKANGIKPLNQDWLTGDRPKLRRFAIYDGDTPVGWVSSVDAGPDETGEDQTWVSGLWVNPDQRGKGYGYALMAAMLADDLARGYQRSVLLASYAGARLYPHVGYERIGTLYLATPKQK